MSKQKSLFDKPIKIQEQKEQIKKEDEFVPFEESIFAKPKANKALACAKIKEDYVPVEFVKHDDEVPLEESVFAKCKVDKVINSNDEHFVADSKGDYVPVEYVEHDDEVPFEESVFAKTKVTKTKVINEKYKKDIEAIYNKYKDLYIRDYISNVKRLNMVDTEVYNNCSFILEGVRYVKISDTESLELSKRIIKSVCTSVEEMFGCYINSNRALIGCISEVNPSINSFEMYKIIDKSYSDLINELRGKNGENS